MFNATGWAAEAVVSGKAQANFYEFLNANEKGSSTSSKSSNTGVAIWERPEEGVVKINVDAAVLKESNMVGTGAIGRGGNGEVLGISGKRHEGISSPRTSEALAIREGMLYRYYSKLFEGNYGIGC